MFEALRTPHIRVAPADAVTSRNVRAEIDPRDVGMSARDVDAMWSSVVRLYNGGLQPAIAVTVRHRGRVILDRAIGHLRGNAPDDPPDAPKVPVRFDSLFPLFSASKSMTAMVIHLLEERGLLRLDDRVADYIPEFACKGKELATIRQVLTHRSGLPTVRNFPVDLDRLADWPYVIDVLCNAPALSVPGSRLAYHALSGGFILGEIARRITGKTVRTLLRDEITAKVGLHTLDYGAAPERLGDIAHSACTGLPPIPPLTWIVSRAFGVDMRRAVELSNDPRYYECIIPSGNVVSTANDTCSFFQLLLNGGELDGVRIFDPRTVARAVTPNGTFEIDSFIGLPVRYGMGFMLGNEGPSLYGFGAARAFGHIGFTTVIAWADPDRALSACMMTSGKPLITPGQVQWMRSVYAISANTPRVASR